MGPWGSNAEKLDRAYREKWAKGLIIAGQGHLVYSW